MTDIQSRVSHCFSIVFPELAPADIPGASQESLTRWDSVAHITLLSAIAEEFQCELDEEFLETLTSYRLIVEYLEARAVHHAQRPPLPSCQ
jgi:acyl carrier protein